MDFACGYILQYRVAAWGLTFAPSLRLDPVASDSQVVAAGPLPGITQTAYRAELYAVMVALKLLEQWGRKGILWIDCQSVLDRYHLYIGGRKRLNPNGPHHDLWVEICRIVHSCGSDIVQLVKVSAHQVWDHETPAVLRWAMIHNGCVDRVARLANQLRGEDFWSLWQLHSAMVHRVQFVSSRIQSHQIEVCRKWSAGVKDTPILAAPRPPRQGRVFLWYGRM